MGQSGHIGRQCLETEVGLMVSSACVRLLVTLGEFGGIILHGEGAGGRWIVLLCAYQQTKLYISKVENRQENGGAH